MSSQLSVVSVDAVPASEARTLPSRKVQPFMSRSLQCRSAPKSTCVGGRTALRRHRLLLLLLLLTKHIQGSRRRASLTCFLADVCERCAQASFLRITEHNQSTLAASTVANSAYCPCRLSRVSCAASGCSCPPASAPRGPAACKHQRLPCALAGRLGGVSGVPIFQLPPSSCLH